MLLPKVVLVPTLCFLHPDIKRSNDTVTRRWEDKEMGRKGDRVMGRHEQTSFLIYNTQVNGNWIQLGLKITT